MMTKEKSFGFSLLLTTVILLSSEIIVSTLFPLLGFQFFRLSIGTLIVLFLSFYRNTTFVALFIIYIQYIHGLFTIESWALGTAAGLGISIIISYLRGWIHLSNNYVTIVLVQIFQTIWFLIVCSAIYFKKSDWALILEKLWLFVPESIVLSLISPFIFRLLNVIWKDEKEQNIQGAN